jgi:hypothetical protein
MEPCRASGKDIPEDGHTNKDQGYNDGRNEAVSMPGHCTVYNLFQPSLLQCDWAPGFYSPGIDKTKVSPYPPPPPQVPPDGVGTTPYQVQDGAGLHQEHTLVQLGGKVNNSGLSQDCVAP